LLVAEEAGDYPIGVPAAVLLSLDAVRAWDPAGACNAVMELTAVLSPAGIGRELVYAAAAAGLPGRDGPLPPMAAEAVDAALARLTGASLLTFSLDGTNVSAHRLVMRIIRETLDATSLARVCQAAAELLDRRAGAVREGLPADRAAARDLIGQVLALAGSASGCPDEIGLDTAMLRARRWALSFLTELRDNPAQAVAVGRQLVIDYERILGPEHPETLVSRNNLSVGCRAAGLLAEAISLDEETLAVGERVLGADHPETLTSRN
jgi:hypothetical protein